MAISYPVDVANTRWAIVRESNGDIVGRRKTWPVADGTAIPGLDPDLIYCLHIDQAVPDYDSNLYTLETVETVDGENNEFRTTYNTAKRPLEEQHIAVDNREIDELRKHVDLFQEAIQTRLALGAVIMAVDQEALDPAAQALLDAYKNKAIKLFKNRKRAQQMKDQCTAGEEPDFEAGWETVE